MTAATIESVCESAGGDLEIGYTKPVSQYANTAEVHKLTIKRTCVQEFIENLGPIIQRTMLQQRVFEGGECPFCWGESSHSMGLDDECDRCEELEDDVAIAEDHRDQWEKKVAAVKEIAEKRELEVDELKERITQLESLLPDNVVDLPK